MKTFTRINRIAACAAFLLAGASFSAAQTLNTSGLIIETVADGLDLPTAMTFLGSDEFLICEKNTGKVKYVVHGVVQNVALDLPVANGFDQGLLGLALDPNFTNNHFVYLYFSLADADGGEWFENRVSRFTWNGATLDLASETPLAVFPKDLSQPNAPNCEGGLLRFGPDGKLYGTVGAFDRGRFDNPRIEQNTSATASSNVGGIFRLNVDGSVPADNPFATHPNESVRRLFTYGCRNSYGMAFDPATGLIWTSENGPDAYDEINLARPGFNSGWLKIMGPDSRNATYEFNEYTPFDAADLTQLTGSHYADPQLSFRKTIGVTSLLFLDSPLYPCELRGRMLLGDYNFGNLYLFELNAARDALVLPDAVADDLVADSDAERDAVVWGKGWGVTSDLRIGPDGFLYQVSLSDGLVRRIRPLQPIGDLNGDAAVNPGDIDAFMLALLDPPAYARYYPDIDANVIGDVNCDGTLDFFDIDPFVAMISR